MEEINLERTEYSNVLSELTDRQRSVLTAEHTRLISENLMLKKTSEPILEFTSIEQAYECLKEWKLFLFLNDWVIRLNLVEPNQMELKNCVGETWYELTLKAANINLLHSRYIDEKNVMKNPQELTLVHELLHCKFNFTDGVKETTEGEFMGTMEHVLIEQMAKTMIMIKYNLDFNWFKNF